MSPANDSPCVNVCVVDPKTAFCIGCGRTAGEIAAWSSMDRFARAGIVRELPTRLSTMTSRQARGTGRAVRHA